MINPKSLENYGRLEAWEYMLRYSRHAKRRMALYAISEEDVALVVKEGKREEVAQTGRMSFTSHLAARSKFPLKVVGLERGKDLLIITAYPLKTGGSEYEDYI